MRYMKFTGPRNILNHAITIRRDFIYIYKNVTAGLSASGP
jgi:hypothetical protein